MKLSWFRLDSTGRESRTLMMVTVSWLLVSIKYTLAGLTVPYIGLVPTMSATEYGTACTAILLIWLGREWVKKT